MFKEHCFCQSIERYFWWVFRDKKLLKCMIWTAFRISWQQIVENHAKTEYLNGAVESIDWTMNSLGERVSLPPCSSFL